MKTATAIIKKHAPLEVLIAKRFVLGTRVPLSRAEPQQGM